MDWTIFWITMTIFLFLLDMGIITATLFAFIISFVAMNIEVSDTNEITVDLDEMKTQLDNLNTKQGIVDVPITPKPMKVISVKKYDDIQRVYISNSKRSYENVQMKTLSGKTYACKDDGTCITEPTMKRHINNALYACDDSICYMVKQNDIDS